MMSAHSRLREVVTHRNAAVEHFGKAEVHMNSLRREIPQKTRRIALGGAALTTLALGIEIVTKSHPILDAFTAIVGYGGTATVATSYFMLNSLVKSLKGLGSVKDGTKHGLSAMIHSGLYKVEDGYRQGEQKRKPA